MRRYLDQLACVLRPGSVNGADLALRSLAAFLVEQAPEVRFIADIRRRHIENFRTWLNTRPGYRTGRLTPPPSPTVSVPCACSSSASATGNGPKRPPVSRSSPRTCPGRTIPCPKPSTTRPRRNCYAPRRPNPACSCAS
jgi:hypothetical protein